MMEVHFARIGISLNAQVAQLMRATQDWAVPSDSLPSPNESVGIDMAHEPEALRLPEAAVSIVY